MTVTNRSLVAVRNRDSRPDLRLAVRDAIDAMNWLTPADQAMSALALLLAEEVENVAGDAVIDVSRLAGQLQGVLRDLGGTPGARAGFNGPTQQGGRLAALRAAATTAG